MNLRGGYKVVLFSFSVSGRQSGHYPIFEFCLVSRSHFRNWEATHVNAAESCHRPHPKESPGPECAAMQLRHATLKRTRLRSD
jgi:hypothetical protein